MSGDVDNSAIQKNIKLGKNPEIVLEAMEKNPNIITFADPSLFTDSVFRGQVIEILKESLIDKVQILFEDCWTDEDINFEIIKNATSTMKVFFNKLKDCGKIDSNISLDKILNEDSSVNESYLDLEMLYEKEEKNWPIDEKSRAKVERMFDGYSLIIESIDGKNPLIISK